MSLLVENYDFKDPDMFGVVFVCDDGLVKVGLMNLTADEQPKLRLISVAAPNNLTIDFSVGWTFAVVESKLFATGGGAPGGGGFRTAEVYFCDLRDATANNEEFGLEFKVAATLSSPKMRPLVVPYKDKIIFIANPFEKTRHINTTPCEILHLAGEYFNVEPLSSPGFWQGHDPMREDTYFDGYVVIRNKLYVRVVSARGRNNFVYILHCLDMDAQVWEEECVCNIPHVLKEIFHEEDERPWNYVHADKFLFKLELDGEDPSIPSLGVEIFSNKDEEEDRDGVKVDLKGIVDFMGLEGWCYGLDGWVLPCDEKTSDVFWLMFWVNDLTVDRNHYLCFCKFRLADDGFFDILTRRVIYVPIPEYCMFLIIGFTPAIAKELNAGDYERKLIQRDHKRWTREIELEMEKIENAKTEEEKREEARREEEEEEEEEKRKQERIFIKFVDWAIEEAEGDEEDDDDD
ncbi:hypothetical protein LINGRAHAP2_LOCUS12281 [Linum grandiflorum]